MKSLFRSGSQVNGKKNAFILLVLLFIMQLPVSGSDGEIKFTVSMDDAVNHNFRVTMTFTGIQQDYTVLKMPVWTPGYYWIQNYPKNLSSMSVKDEKGNLLAGYKKMVQSAVGLIGEMPYRHYTFLIMGAGGGGLEHANSQAIFTGFRGADIYPTERKAFLGWMSFIAHEYFHLYNVKTIRPIALGPFDYDRENYTNMLWVSEGFTVYFEDIILIRAGFMNGDEMLESLSRSITNYESVPGSRVQPVTLSSFDTWINFFNRSPNVENTTISYYDKGCGLGLLLDLKIRNETDNAKSLIDVMRRLYYHYYKELGRGFTDAEFRSECESIGGCSLEEIFGYASSTVRPDYNRYLDYAGLYMTEEPSGDSAVRSKFTIKRKENMTPRQKKIYDDMFKPV